MTWQVLWQCIRRIDQNSKRQIGKHHHSYIFGHPKTDNLVYRLTDKIIIALLFAPFDNCDVIAGLRQFLLYYVSFSPQRNVSKYVNFKVSCAVRN